MIYLCCLVQAQIGFVEWQPPAPFGIIHSIFSGRIHLGAFKTCLPTMCALAFVYVIRSSLHAAALKKNIPNVTRKKPISERGDSPKPKAPVSLQKILREGYGYSQLMASVAGGIGVAPAVAVALTLFKVRTYSTLRATVLVLSQLHDFPDARRLPIVLNRWEPKVKPLSLVHSPC